MEKGQTIGSRSPSLTHERDIGHRHDSAPALLEPSASLPWTMAGQSHGAVWLHLCREEAAASPITRESLEIW